VSEILQFQEIEHFTKKNLALGRKAYLLNVSEVDFGFLYVSPEFYTLAWNSNTDFSLIDKTALYSLPTYLPSKENRWKINEVNLAKVTKVSLIFPGASDELVQYNLSSPADSFKYHLALKEVWKISFIRYDVRSEPPFLYSFTAENPYFSPTQEGELAIKLPKSQLLTMDLLGWIMDNHTAGGTLENEVDLKTSSEKISTLVNSTFY
jgi:hypothetical protein